MSEEFDLSDVLEKAKNANTAKKNAKKSRTRWIIAGTLLLAIVSIFAINMQNWFAPDDFNKEIPLKQNLTRWTSLSWGAEGNWKTDNLNTPTGDWSLNNENGHLTNPEYAGCVALFTKTRGDYGDNANDYEDTMRYKAIFETGQENSKTKNVWVPLAGHDTRGIEILKTSYVDEAGNYAIAYYRHSPLNETLFFGTIRCDDAETLEELAPWEANGSEITDMGIWLKY